MSDVTEVKYQAGIVTSYGAAKKCGYTGTYAEFCAEQAGFAENAQQVAEDRAAVEELVPDVRAELEQAETELNQAVADAKDEIDTKAQDAIDSIPADYTALTQEVNGLKSDLNVVIDTIGTDTNATIVFEQGSINGSSGGVSSSTTRCRTPYIASPSNLGFIIDFPSSYKYTVYEYTTNANTGYTGSPLLLWGTGKTFVPITSGHYIRIVVAYTNDSTITPEQITGYSIKAYRYKNVSELEQKIYTNTIDLMTDCVNVFSTNTTDYLIGKGYSGNTGTIVDSTLNVITGYIPVKKDDCVQVFVNGINIINTYVDGQNRKIALYDAEKNWYKTITYRSDTSDTGALIIPETGFIRVMLRLNEIREIYVSSIRKNKLVDLLLFAGQSNMAGRGVTSTEWPQTAPDVIPGAGYEYRAISAPNELSPITPTFGLNENNPDGIDDSSNKTGGLVPAFTNAYYTANGKVPLVGVSASKGGTSTFSWLPGGAFFNDITERVNRARNYLADNMYSVRHNYVIFCQGESDGDNIANGTETLAQYQENTLAIINGFINLGFEKVLLVRIGNYNVSTSTRYKPIIEWQTELAKTNKNVVMVSCDFAGMMADGLMKDHFHYYQEGYNIAGNSAGTNSAFFAMTQKEPTMYDTENENLYYTHIN